MTTEDLHEGWTTLTVPSDLKMMSIIRHMVKTVCELAGMDDGASHEVVLAVHEACTNVIRHAHGGRSDLSVTVACRTGADVLEVHIHDQGERFDISTVPELDPREVREGGRGVYLIRRLMDEVSSLPRAEGGNALCMIKKLHTGD